MRRKTLIVVASVGALLIVALLLARVWLMRDTTAPVSLDRVVEDYRGETPATASAPPTANGRIPMPGVYTYATSGQEQASVLGTSRHVYPAVTSIAIRATRCGFHQTWIALDKRVEEWTFCRRGDGLKPQRFRDVHSFYGHDDDRTYACRGDGVFPLQVREGVQTFSCKTDSTTRTDRVRTIGREPLRVGGSSVDTVHLRDRITLMGETTTEVPGTTDWWLDAETGLPIQIRVEIEDATDTPIGKQAQYEERYELKLRSLTPES